MLLDIIKAKLTERFSTPLPECHRRRIVFWRDENGEFAETFDNLVLNGVTLKKLTGKNSFAIKKLLTTDDLDGDYLIYDPLDYRRGFHEDWLLDIKLYSGEIFRADSTSLRMEELNVEPTAEMRRTINQYSKFFDNKERRTKLSKIGTEYKTPFQLHVSIMAVLCGLNTGMMQDVIIAVLSTGLDSSTNPLLTNIERYGVVEVFWSLVENYTGYMFDRGGILERLATHILITALAQTIPVAKIDTLKCCISETKKIQCYHLVHDWAMSENKKHLYEICRRVEKNLQLTKQFSNIEIETLLESDIFPAIDENILERCVMDINDGVVKVDGLLKAIENRRTSIWYDQFKDYVECLYNIAKMCEFYQMHNGSVRETELSKIWELYTDHAYKMDSYFRHYCQRYSNEIKNSNTNSSDSLKSCTDTVKKLYCDWFLMEINEPWTKAINDEKNSVCEIPNVANHSDFVRNYVENSNNRVFIIISDVLRYDVAAELTCQLNQTTKGKATIDSVYSKIPISKEKREYKSLTENTSLIESEVETGSGLFLDVDDKKRVAVDHKELLKMKKTERRLFVQGREVVCIYCKRDYDEVLGSGHDSLKVFGKANDELTAIIKMIINELSGVHIIITSSAGLHYADIPNHIDKSMCNGISIQQLILPVIIYKGMRSNQKDYVERQNTGLMLISECRKITNQVFSLEFLQERPVGEKVAANQYSLYFTNDEGMLVSDKRLVIADKMNTEALGRVFEIRFILKPMQFDRNKIYYLVITNDSVTTDKIEFSIDIVYSEDFNSEL